MVWSPFDKKGPSLPDENDPLMIKKKNRKSKRQLFNGTRIWFAKHTVSFLTGLEIIAL